MQAVKPVKVKLGLTSAPEAVRGARLPSTVSLLPRRISWLRLAPPGPRLMLALACAVLVLAPSLIAAELIVRSYAQTRIDDTRSRTLAGLDSATTLLQQ